MPYGEKTHAHCIHALIYRRKKHIHNNFTRSLSRRSIHTPIQWYTRTYIRLRLSLGYWNWSLFRCLSLKSNSAHKISLSMKSKNLNQNKTHLTKESVGVWRGRPCCLIDTSGNEAPTGENQSIFDPRVVRTVPTYESSQTGLCKQSLGKRTAAERQVRVVSYAGKTQSAPY